MFLVSWLLSWWVVPAYRDLGPATFHTSVWYGSFTMYILWAISAPLGALLVAIGTILISDFQKIRLWIFTIGGLVLLVWLAFWSVSTQYPVLYRIGGGCILILFLITFWQWAKSFDHN